MDATICYYLGLAILTTLITILVIQLSNQLKQSRNRNKLALLEAERLVQQVSGILANTHAQQSNSHAWQGWRKFRIERIVRENATIKSFYLYAHDGKPLTPFLPGQFLTFRLKVPGQSRPVTRCYSLSHSGDETDYYRVSIREQLAPREDLPHGLSSHYFHQHLEEGDIVDVKAPSGQFYLDMTEKTPAVLIGGGIGLTPMLSMFETLDHRGSHREAWLLYGARDTDDLIMSERLDSIAQGSSNRHLHRFFSEQESLDQPLQLAGGIHTGRITAQAMKDLGVPMDADFYICGPGPMIDAVVADLESEGVDASRIHFESFGPASPSKNRQQPSDEQTATSQNLSVEFSVSKKSIEWSSQRGSLLEAAEEAGVVIDSSCRSGNCGACMTRVVDGDIEYTDTPGVDVDKGYCLPCISVAKQAVTLGL